MELQDKAEELIADWRTTGPIPDNALEKWAEEIDQEFYLIPKDLTEADIERFQEATKMEKVVGKTYPECMAIGLEALIGGDK